MTVGVNEPPALTRRIGLDIPVELLDRLDMQAVFVGWNRQALIITAVTGLVREFEQIDVECGVACPDCGADTDVDTLSDGEFRVCVRCRWRLRLSVA